MGGMDALGTATKWLSLVSGVLTLILGIIHICTMKAHVTWPRGKITDETEATITWRMRLFSFVPEIFTQSLASYAVDAWTPLIFGLILTMANLKGFEKCHAITRSYGRLCAFLVISALFATLGYRGGLGILFGTVTLLTALMALVSIFVVDDKNASLDLNVGVSAK